MPIDGWDIITSVFEKTNVHHIGNILSVSISTICPWSGHFSAPGHRISSKSKHLLRKYDVISISEDGGRDGWILLPVSYLLMSLPSEGQSLLANQLCGDISIGGWDITTFGFEIQTSAISEFYFWFRSRPVRHNLHVILHEATELRPNRSTHCGNMTSYPFLNMAAATAKYYFRFRIC